MYKVALWGLGGGYDYFVSHHGYEMVEVVCIADKRACGRGIDGIRIISPDRIKEFEFDYLIVTMLNEYLYKEVVEKAVRFGISRDRIIPVRVFEIPFFDFNKYIEIKNSNISILSDCCFAGFLYHRFGLQFTSPTINMYATNENYYRFLYNLESYLKLPMVEEKNSLNKPYLGLYSIPRGYVGDTEWIFNHDEVYETAAARWKRGCERFNNSNFIAVMAIQSDEMAYKFDELPIKHKLGFYWKELDLKSVVCLPEWNNPTVRMNNSYLFSGLVNHVASETEGMRVINWMMFLLHEDGYNRRENE